MNTADASPTQAPAGPTYSKLRVFVASENTEQVWVLDGAPKDKFVLVGKIPVGKLPHGIWPSGDGSRIYVGLENADGMAAIDTATNKLIATSPIGQAPQAIT